MNGELVARFAASRNWQTVELSVPGERVVAGLNEVVVTWPEPDGSSDEALSQAADLLSAKHLPRFYPVFGEIHSLLVFGPADKP